MLQSRDLSLRIVLLDLLAERAEFGHGGNLEMLRPYMQNGTTVEVWLLTPQFQSVEIGKYAAEVTNSVPATAVALEEEDVPTWDAAFPFVQEEELELDAGRILLRRIALPVADPQILGRWLTANRVDAVYCSGSRRNVSIWEEWMDSAADLLRAAVELELATLGICFGHQLLCQALGGAVDRVEQHTAAVHELELTPAGMTDPLFAGIAAQRESRGTTSDEEREASDGNSDSRAPVGLFTHQDQVTALPDCLISLASAPHTLHVAVRLSDTEGRMAPVWGVQFHPEATKQRIKRALKLGHISKAEAQAFKKEHDGAQILANFAAIVTKQNQDEATL
jgi:GMP synthase-like glutamine amidotransferase